MRSSLRGLSLMLLGCFTSVAFGHNGTLTGRHGGSGRGGTGGGAGTGNTAGGGGSAGGGAAGSAAGGAGSSGNAGSGGPAPDNPSVSGRPRRFPSSEPPAKVATAAAEAPPGRRGCSRWDSRLAGTSDVGASKATSRSTRLPRSETTRASTCPDHALSLSAMSLRRRPSPPIAHVDLDLAADLPTATPSDDRILASSNPLDRSASRTRSTTTAAVPPRRPSSCPRTNP